MVNRVWIHTLLIFPNALKSLLNDIKQISKSEMFIFNMNAYKNNEIFFAILKYYLNESGIEKNFIFSSE